MANHRKCRICGEPVILSPSANERSRKYGETPEFYRDLFPDHADCVIRKRSDETAELCAIIRRNDALRYLNRE